MANFLDFEYDEVAETVYLGSGWIFDKVYHKLQPYNRTVAGSRSPGVGAYEFSGDKYPTDAYFLRYGLCVWRRLFLDCKPARTW
jgi:hypothetical protein